jgi:hypothetical protein
MAMGWGMIVSRSYAYDKAAPLNNLIWQGC